VRQSLLRPGDDDDEALSISSGIDEANGIFFISMDDELIALSLKDGKVLWRQVP
jgi:hypothetical protein